MRPQQRITKARSVGRVSSVQYGASTPALQNQVHPTIQSLVDRPSSHLVSKLLQSIFRPSEARDRLDPVCGMVANVSIVQDRVAAFASAVSVTPEHAFCKEASAPGRTRVSRYMMWWHQNNSLADPDIVHANPHRMTGGVVHDHLSGHLLTAAGVIEVEDAALGT